MRVFLHENVDPRLASELTGFEVDSVRTRGWLGVSNGELLAKVELDFDVIISHDQGLQHQQNWRKRTLSLIVIESPSTRFDSYSTALDELREAISSSGAGVVKRIRVPG